jgi:hypothetical protein
MIKIAHMAGRFTGNKQAQAAFWREQPGWRLSAPATICLKNGFHQKDAFYDAINH